MNLGQGLKNRLVVRRVRADLQQASFGMILLDDSLVPPTFTVHQEDRVTFRQPEYPDGMLRLLLIKCMGFTSDMGGVEQVHGLDLNLKIVN